MDEPRWVAPASPEWPDRLDHLERPPLGFWQLGSVGPASASVAVVGSRRATFGGVEVARSIGRELGAAGIQVVSGMALGIDAAAHDGALEAGGSTVAVLGCGIDVCYPLRHMALRSRIADSGSVITEEPAGTPPLKYNFPKRNRIIAALALAVVVVEATERSGALSTARWAADLGRDVLAVPGSIRAPQSSGTNLLIRDGARPFLGIGDLFDVVAALGVAVPKTAAGVPADARRGGLERFSPPLREILARMGTQPVHPDQIGVALALSPSVVATRLGALELAGAVMSLPGGLVARTV
ncbi:MAG TPA: DNA-processing protein DprA [Candidatus Acidoferrales bacterium]|nr:DNA-processing protein DprA [Candidatus Acidoferrales bacterium]